MNVQISVIQIRSPILLPVKAQRKSRDNFTLPLTSALDEDACSTLCFGRFTPRKDTVPIVQNAGLVSGPVCIVWKVYPCWVLNPEMFIL